MALTAVISNGVCALALPTKLGCQNLPLLEFSENPDKSFGIGESIDEMSPNLNLPAYVIAPKTKLLETSKIMNQKRKLPSGFMHSRVFLVYNSLYARNNKLLKA
jgi:hypothetical protein